MTCRENFLKLISDYTIEMVKLYPRIIISSNLLDLNSICPNMKSEKGEIVVTATFQKISEFNVHIIDAKIK